MTSEVADVLDKMKNQDDLTNKEKSPTVNSEDKNLESDHQSNTSDSDKLTETERKAYEKGWRPREAYQGDSESFISAHEYLRYGQLQEATQKQLKDQESTFNKQMEQLAKLKEAEFSAKIDELKLQRRQAVEDSDTDKFDSIQNRIDKLQKTSSETAIQPSYSKPIEVLQWEANNPWINDDTVQAAGAKAIWNNYIMANPTASASQAISHLESKLKGQVNTNPMRSAAPLTSTKGKVSYNKANSETMSWSNLTREEEMLWERAKGSIWQDSNDGKKNFLKAVQSSRSETQQG